MEIGAWTAVPVTNSFAASIISLYLETDHPLLGFFDADLFLDALVSKERYFCSKLLVNALLSWASVSISRQPHGEIEMVARVLSVIYQHAYSVFEPEAAGLGLLFYGEASRHWQTEKATNTLTATAAAQFLSLVATCYGKDEEAVEYVKAGIEMGERMGLFGVHLEAASASKWLDDHQDWVRAASHTAWGIFCWVTYVCSSHPSRHWANMSLSIYQQEAIPSVPDR
jgi:hypothetical protein